MSAAARGNGAGGHEVRPYDCERFSRPRTAADPNGRVKGDLRAASRKRPWAEFRRSSEAELLSGLMRRNTILR
jgi:hypothetical protein